ncbi:hypothetical protein [Paenibacillus sp. FSL P4-0288]|uniref:hypothetical protein n=1 Tax=Paenibacillus sp. FSL P4-0288 TaxID=2921633 RepID=UPI0030FC252F
MEIINRYAADTPRAYRTIAFLIENESFPTIEKTETNLKFIFGSWDNPINLIEFVSEYGFKTNPNPISISLFNKK